MESFATAELDEQVLRGVYTHGFETPSEIQKQTLLPLVQGRDVIAQAQSGTGKTGAFAIAVTQRIKTDSARRALILCPTRELALQTISVCDAIAQYTKHARTCACVGGRSVNQNKREIEEGATILVGTPGRVRDLLTTRLAWLGEQVDMLIVDEADQFLVQDEANGSFLDMFREIVQALPKNAQIALFSATMPSEMLSVTTQFMNDPLKVLRPPETLSLDGITQYYVHTSSDQDKFAAVEHIFSTTSISGTIIYLSSRARVDWLTAQLQSRSYPVDRIHAGLTPEERADVMRRFRAGDLRVLISSALTARGIDVQSVQLVIQFDLNTNIEDYIHCVGRSGRYGRKGTAVLFVTERDAPILSEIESHYKLEMNAMPAQLTL